MPCVNPERRRRDHCQYRDRRGGSDDGPPASIGHQGKRYEKPQLWFEREQAEAETGYPDVSRRKRECKQRCGEEAVLSVGHVDECRGEPEREQEEERYVDLRQERFSKAIHRSEVQS